jgi:hypothetical protein
MAERHMSQRETLNSDVPGDIARVRMILLSWGVEEASIRSMMRERRMEREHRTYPRREPTVARPAQYKPGE